MKLKNHIDLKYKYGIDTVVNCFFSITVVLVPFLYQYASPISFLSLGDFLLIFSSGCAICFDVSHNKKVSYDRNLTQFVIVLLLINLISALFNKEYYIWEDALTMIFKMIMYCIVLNVAFNHFNLSLVYKLYEATCIGFCAYLFIQVIYYNVAKDYLPIYLNYDWLFNWEKRTTNLATYYYRFYYKYRPSSLFMEPSYYAFYEMPFLYITLLKNKNIILSLFITISFVLSTSGTGVLLGGLAWFLFFFYGAVKNKEGGFKTNKITIALLLICVIAFLFMSVYGISIAKYFNSFNSRITRGFLILSSFSFERWLFGSGINNVSNYMNRFSISTSFDEANMNFGSTLTKSFMELGICGTLSYVFFLYRYYYKYIRKKGKLIVSMFILLIAYIVFEDMFFIYRMGFFFSFIYYFAKKETMIDGE